ncbi:MAG: efflux RND transporter permease subunit [Pseudomonadota bacterium]
MSDSRLDTHAGIIAWFARNSVAANLLMIGIMLCGIYGAITIQKKVFPQFIINTITVQVPYNGAAPQEVEEGVILRIENAIKDLEGIKKLTSTAREGLGTVRAEVEDEFDVQIVLDEIKSQVDAISSFPADTENPVVYRSKATESVLWISVYGDVGERRLKETATEMQNEIANLPGISSVRIVGARDYEISIEISEQELQSYALTFDDLVSAVRRSSIDIPGGAIRSDDGDILLRAKGQAYNAYDFAQISLINRSDGTRLLLGDIATINDGFVEENSFSTFNGKEAISIEVQAIGDQNALKISEEVNKYLEAKALQLPANISADSWGDASFYLADRLNMMLENMAIGALLVFFILALFLKIKLAFWVMVGLPVCFLGTLLLMPIFGITINLISLFGFILVLGIVVDDAIIMGESAYSEIDKHGHSIDNVIRGVKRVAMPATFGVLTTIAAFTPLLMVTGTFGIIWKTIGVVVIFCLIFSLVESKLILPAHLANMRVPDPNAPKNKLQLIRERFNALLTTFIHKKYKPFLVSAIKYKMTTLVSFFAMMILTVGLFAGGVVRFVFFPNIASDFINASVEMEQGTSILQRDKVLKNLIIAADKMNQAFVETHGTEVVKHVLAFDEGALGGFILIELSKGETREVSDNDIKDVWRKFIPEMAGIRTLSLGSEGGPGSGNRLDLEFSSKDISALVGVSAELKAFLKEYEGVSDVNDTFSASSDEIQLQLKPEAEALGISLSQLAQQVRYGFYGAEAQRIQRDEEEVRVMIRYPKDQRDSIGNLENMRIRASNGDEIPFSQVADIKLDKGYTSIIRVDGERAVTVSAELNTSIVEPNAVLEEVEKEVTPPLLEKYPQVDFKLQGSAREQKEGLIALGLGFLFAVACVYALMAIPLKSYSQPLIIMSIIPFGVVGAIIGHLIMGKDVSVLSICGIIALSGVVVNDSLIMVDFISRARKEGLSLIDAVTSSGTKRFRAIILTSLTTFFGLVPILLERSLQAQAVIPMAISLAFGILFATVITLILVPTLYVLLDDVKRLFRGKQQSSVDYKGAQFVTDQIK